MFQDYLKALSLILFAEMGDKTQIIAMTFAMRYAMKDILTGVALGAGFNHAIAIVLGTLLTKFINVDFLQLVAGMVFIVFAMLSLGTEDEDEDEEKNRHMSPIITVAFAFFMGELGDKTQISALTLSLDSNYPLFILLGTTSGMVLTSLLGIIIGSKLGKKIPEFHLKVAAFTIFLIFGIEKFFNSQYLTYFGKEIGYGGIAAVAFFGLIRFYRFYQFEKSEPKTPLRIHADEIYKIKHTISKTLDKMCLNDNICKECVGEGCIVNYMKKITEESINSSEPMEQNELSEVAHMIVDNTHEKASAKEILEEIELYLEKFPSEKGNIYIQKIKKTSEKIISED
ncbi:MAG: TMEM165/GDT1 family protein [Fusobacteriaceae bacterium]